MRGAVVGMAVLFAFLALCVPAQAVCEDMNGDGVVDIYDLVLDQNPNIVSGDTNADSKVNIIDLATVGLAYGSEPGDSNWNPDADVANTVDRIDIFDLATVGLNYNKVFVPDPNIDPIFTVSPGHTDLTKGLTASVDINIQTVPAEAQVYALEVEIHFNPAAVSVQGATEGTFLKQGTTSPGSGTFTIITINNTLGTLKFASTRYGVTSGANGSGLLLNIVFKGENAGNSGVDFGKILVSDPQLQPMLNITRNNGTIKVVLSFPPNVTGVSDDSSAASPTNVGDDVNFEVDWTDPDSTQTRVYVCDSNTIDSAGCHSQEFCSTANSAANPKTCQYTTQQSDSSTEQYWAAVCDDSDVCSPANGPHTFHVNHAPVVNVSDQNTDEDTQPPANWVDLWAFTNDLEDPDSTLTFSLTGETNPALIDCQLDGNRYINCGKPAQDQSGFSGLTVTATDPNGLVGQDTFRVYVNPVNDPPTAPVVDVTPNAPVTSDNLVCNIVTPSDDADGDPVIYYYAWYKNTVLQGGLTTNTVNSAFTAKGQTWRCNATPTDATVNGTSAEDQVTIGNTCPSIDSINPGSDPTIGEHETQLFCITKSDDDTDPLTTRWYLDGGEVLSSTSCYTYEPDYDSSGAHPVKAEVDDGTCKTSHSWTATIQDTQQRVDLSEGTNLFSLPRVPASGSIIADDLESDCEVTVNGAGSVCAGDNIAYWNPLAPPNGSYMCLGLDDPLFPGQAYFAKVVADCYFVVTGEKFGLGDGILGYVGTNNLYTGWNNLGALTQRTLFANIQASSTCDFGGVVPRKYAYGVTTCVGVPDYNGGYEQCELIGGVSRCFCEVSDFAPGFGYYVSVEADCTIA